MTSDPRAPIDPVRRKQNQRVAVIALLLSFGPLVLVACVLAVRGSSSSLTPATALLLLAVVIIGPLLGFVALVVLRRRQRL